MLSTVFRYHLVSLSSDFYVIKWNINQNSIRVFEYPFDYIEIRTQQYEVIAKNGRRHRSQREKYSENQPSELWRILIFLCCVLLWDLHNSTVKKRKQNRDLRTGNSWSIFHAEFHAVYFLVILHCCSHRAYVHQFLIRAITLWLQQNNVLKTWKLNGRIQYFQGHIWNQRWRYI